MTDKGFLGVKLKSYKPLFSQLVGLVESPRTSVLWDFMARLHPNPTHHRQARGSRGEVFGKYYFTFILYTTGVLRTNQSTGTKRFYPFKND